jgi:hypothetical protein
VIELLARTAWSAASNGLRIIMMCEIPSNAVLADQFLEHFDGFSIGSNDMTQLTLGAGPDSGIVAGLRRARSGGQAHAASGDPGLPQGRQVRRHLRTGAVGSSRLAEWLMEEGIERFRSIPTRWSRPGFISHSRPREGRRREAAQVSPGAAGARCCVKRFRLSWACGRNEQ